MNLLQWTAVIIGSLCLLILLKSIFLTVILPVIGLWAAVRLFRKGSKVQKYNNNYPRY